MHASNYGHLEVVRLLLEKGADPSAQNAKGRTALMLASNNGHSEVIKVLLNVGVGEPSNITSSVF